jgi:tRNA(Ile)-lysidine synthase
MSTFELRVLETIKRHGLVRVGDTILAAVSGGPDSVAMLCALLSLAEGLNARVEAAHLNHALRGAESDADQQYVRGLCAQLSVPCTTERLDVAASAREKRMGIEEAARVARYQFLEQVADRVGASRIAVAHTSDDQVETILLNLLRGAGSDGLAGMPIQRGRIIRPLLDVSRADVEKYCAERGLTPRVDSSNLALDAARNRIRNQVLPLLETEQPAIRSSLLRLASLLRRETTLLEQMAQRRLAKILLRRDAGCVVLDAPKLRRSDPALRARIIRAALREVRGGLADIEQVHVEAVAALVEGHSGRALHLPDSLTASYSQGQLLISNRALPEPAPAQHILEIPGAVTVPSLAIEIRARLLEQPAAVPPNSHRPFEAILDHAALRPPLVVRTWQPGDRFHPMGAPGTMKLHDFFINEKVPRHERRRVPIVADAQGIVWVVGHRIDERFRVSERTRVILSLSAAPASKESSAF